MAVSLAIIKVKKPPCTTEDAQKAWRQNLMQTSPSSSNAHQEHVSQYEWRTLLERAAQHVYAVWHYLS